MTKKEAMDILDQQYMAEWGITKKEVATFHNSFNYQAGLLGMMLESLVKAFWEALKG